MKSNKPLNNPMLTLGAVLLGGLSSANADILAGYDFGSAGSGTNTLSATTVASGASASAVSGAGAASDFILQTTLGDNTGFAASGTAFGATDAGNFSGTANDATGEDLATAIADGDYVTVTVTADVPGTLNVSGFSIAAAIANLTNGRPAEFFNVVAQVNGGNTWEASGALFPADQEITVVQGLGDWDDFYVDLSSNSALQGVDSVEFRVYFWGGSSDSSSSRTNYDQIVVEGSIGTPSTPFWQVDGNGNWTTPANWIPSVPNGAGAIARFSDSLPLTGPISVALDAPVTVGDLILDSAQPITLAGPSALTLDGSGQTNVSSSAGSHELTAAVSLSDPLQVDLAGVSMLDISGALSGGAPVTVAGGGRLRLSGDLSGFSGGLIADGGTLEVSSSGINADISINTGSTLAGEGSHTGTLNLADGSFLSINPVSAEAFTTGTLSPAGTTSVVFDSFPSTAGVFTVINYGNYGGTVNTDFVLENSANYRTPNFVNDSANGRITYDAAFETHSWTGEDATNPTYWDVGISENWSSSDKKYFDFDHVVFGDDGAGYLDVQSNVSPGTVSFANDFYDYFVEDLVANEQSIRAAEGGINVTGEGYVDLNVKITGETDITHSGYGTLTLGGGEVDNDFVGTVTVDGEGILKNARFQADINSLGDFGNTFSFSNGSVFDINPASGTGATDNGYKSYAKGSFVFGDGTTLTNSSAITARNAFDDELVFGGDVTIDGYGRLDIDGDIEVTGTDIVITANNTTGSVLGTSNAGKSIAEWVVNAGILFASHDASFGEAVVTINSGGAITGNIGSAGGGITNIANAITLNGGELRANQNDTTSHYSGTVTVTDYSRIDPNRDNRTVILSGVLAESGFGGDLGIGDGTTVIASTLDASGFTGDFILDETGTLELGDTVNLVQDVVIDNFGGNKVIQLSAGNSAEISGDISVLDADAEQFDLFVAEALDTLTISGVVSGSGAAGVTKTGAGTVMLTNVNSYIGDTTVYAGVLSLGDGTNATELEDTADVRLMGAATLDLNFTGTDQIDMLFINGVGQASGTWGAIGSGADHESGFITGTGMIEVLTEGSIYDLWVGSFAGLTDSDPNVDSDGGGFETAFEYVWGGDPTNPEDDRELAPTSVLDEAGSLVFTGRLSDLAAGDPNTSIVIEYGSDLTGWTEATDGVDGVTITIVPDVYEPGIAQVTVSLPASLAVEGKLFVRMEATIVMPTP
ncbi:beta strand repeat-containing protein [Haloferula chungangensis]|uniref:Beta strand repeat-containing protein n=1 Tax=Haloferula chungangensis TaxID=1048331 RepID=A0ABW2LCN3_9BACT